MKTGTKRKSMHRSSLALAAAAALISALGAQSVTAEEVPREYIYGAELMTPQERDTYRRNLQQAPSEDVRSQYRLRHRQQLQKRAQQRGKHLDEKGLVREQGSER